MKYLILVGFCIALFIMSGCTIPDTVGSNIPQPAIREPFTDAEQADSDYWIAATLCGTSCVSTLSLTTDIGTSACSFFSCTLVYNVVTTRIVDRNGFKAALAIAFIPSWIGKVFATYAGYVTEEAHQAIARVPDGCLAVRFFRGTVWAEWIGHVAATNSKCHHG